MAAGVTARFIYLETGVAREYSSTKDELKQDIANLSFLNTVADELLDNQPTNVKDFEEYRVLSETVKSANDSIGKFDSLLSKTSGISGMSIAGLKHFGEQISNFSIKVKAQTDALQKVVDTLSVDDVIDSLKTAITDAQLTVNEGVKILGNGVTSDLSTEIENATSLIGADIDDSAKAQSSSTLRDQLKDQLSKLQQKTVDLKDKVARKKGTSTSLQDNSTTKAK